MDKRRSVLNIVVSVGFKIILTIVAVLLRSFLIRFCGNEINGLNSLYLSIIGFFAVAELGIGDAITFCMYKPIVEGRKNTITALYNLFNKTYFFVGIFVFVAGIGLSPFLPLLAKDCQQVDVNLYTPFFLMLISVVITYGYGAKTSLIIAHKDNYIATIIASVGTILLYVMQITVLILTGSFELYLVCRIVSAIVQGIATNIIARKKYPDIVLNQKQRLDIDTRKELLAKIKALFMHKTGTLLVTTVDNLVISIFVGVVSLGEYSNYSTIKSSMHAILALAFSSLTSILGHLYVRENKETTKRYCEFIHLLNFVLGMVFYLGYYAVIDDLISALFSADLVVEKSVSFVIALNGFIHFMRSSVLVFRDATGCFVNDQWKPLVEGVVNVILSILFVKHIGVVGVIVATIVTNLLICHIIEPYVLYINAFVDSPKSYYKRNYGMIVCFLLAMIVLNCCMVSIENIFVEFFVNGAISLCISIPICIAAILVQWKKCGPIFTDYFRRRNT